METVEKIIGKQEAQDLRDELNDALSTEDVCYEDIEDIMMGYGLEMDYFLEMF